MRDEALQGAMAARAALAAAAGGRLPLPGTAAKLRGWRRMGEQQPDPPGRRVQASEHPNQIRKKPQSIAVYLVVKPESAAACPASQPSSPRAVSAGSLFHPGPHFTRFSAPHLLQCHRQRPRSPSMLLGCGARGRGFVPSRGSPRAEARRDRWGWGRGLGRARLAGWRGRVFRQGLGRGGVTAGLVPCVSVGISPRAEGRWWSSTGLLCASPSTEVCWEGLFFLPLYRL